MGKYVQRSILSLQLESNGKLLSFIKEFAIEISREMLKISYSLTRIETAGQLIYACLQESRKVHHSTIVCVTKRKGRDLTQSFAKPPLPSDNERHETT